MRERGGLPVEQHVRVPHKIAGFRQRIEQDIGKIVIRREIAQLGRFGRGVRGDLQLLKWRGHRVFTVKITLLRQSQQRRQRCLDIECAVGILGKILVVGLRHCLGRVLRLRRHRVIRKQHPHVEQLLDPLSRAASRRRQHVRVPRGPETGRRKPGGIPVVRPVVDLR